MSIFKVLALILFIKSFKRLLSSEFYLKVVETDKFLDLQFNNAYSKYSSIIFINKFKYFLYLALLLLQTITMYLTVLNRLSLCWELTLFSFIIVTFCTVNLILYTQV